MAKTALVVIYNHHFPVNVDKIEKIYGERFDKIFHVMPFYEGDDDRIIPIYENSYQFQGYIAQAVDKFYSDEYEYFAFMGDDVLLNPNLSNKTIEDVLKVDKDTGYIARNIKSMTLGHVETRKWILPSIANYLHCEDKEAIDKLLPSPQEIAKKYEKLGLSCKIFDENAFNYLFDYMKIQPFWNFFYKIRFGNLEFDLAKIFEQYEKNATLPLKPLIPFSLGFSDFFVLPKRYIKDFVRICGIFAHARIFVEVAIPTTMVILLDKISLPQDLNQVVVNYNTKEARAELVERHGGSIKHIMENWEQENILVHPVKYSQWSLDI